MLIRMWWGVSFKGRDHSWGRGRTLQYKMEIERVSLGGATEGDIPLGFPPGGVQWDQPHGSNQEPAVQGLGQGDSEVVQFSLAYLDLCKPKQVSILYL